MLIVSDSYLVRCPELRTPPPSSEYSLESDLLRRRWSTGWARCWLRWPPRSGSRTGSRWPPTAGCPLPWRTPGTPLTSPVRGTEVRQGQRTQPSWQNWIGRDETLLNGHTCRGTTITIIYWCIQLGVIFFCCMCVSAATCKLACFFLANIYDSMLKERLWLWWFINFENLCYSLIIVIYGWLKRPVGRQGNINLFSSKKWETNFCCVSMWTLCLTHCMLCTVNTCAVCAFHMCSVVLKSW